MKTVLVFSRKGGTGKTTTVHALGTGLMKQGKRVLFLDMDGQANLTLLFGVSDENPGAYDLLCGRVPISKLIQHTEQGDLVPGNEAVHASDKLLDGVQDTFILAKALEEVKKQYDYCIIDAPAALGMITMNCIIAANKIIVPVQAELFSVQGLAKITNMLDTIEEQCGEKRKIDGILLTQSNSRTNVTKSISSDFEEVAKQYKTKIYQTRIRWCTALIEAALMQQSIFDYAPRSNAAKDYAAFINEFVG